MPPPPRKGLWMMLGHQRRSLWRQIRRRSLRKRRTQRLSPGGAPGWGGPWGGRRQRGATPPPHPPRTCMRRHPLWRQRRRRRLRPAAPRPPARPAAVLGTRVGVGGGGPRGSWRPHGASGPRRGPCRAGSRRSAGALRPATGQAPSQARALPRPASLRRGGSVPAVVLPRVPIPQAPPGRRPPPRAHLGASRSHTRTQG